MVDDIVIVRARAARGPADDGILRSPARFEVLEYVQGRGPDVITVATTMQGSAISSDALEVRPGEVWELRGSLGKSGEFSTNVCSDSRRL